MQKALLFPFFRIGIILICWFLVSGGMNAQTCGGSFNFTTQAQIDDFPLNNPGCTQILGSVTIQGVGISNLNGLASITSIGGGLNINNNSSLVSVSGLEALTTVGSHLNIHDNEILVSLSGFSSLTSIGGCIFIRDNPNLTSCEMQAICDELVDPSDCIYISGNAPGCMNIGQIQAACGIPITCSGTLYLGTQEEVDAFPTSYPGCTTFSGDITIQELSEITNLNGLAQLEAIEGGLWISDCSSLTSLEGLNGLTYIGGDLAISDDSGLSSLSGLNSLETIEGSLYIASTQLNNLSGLNALSSIGEYLSFWENYSLTSLSGLDAVTSIGAGFDLSGCEVLTDLSGLSSLTSIGEDFSIYYNTSLSSLAGLSSLNSIGGFIYIIENPQLSYCEVQAVCDKLLTPTEFDMVGGNASGCLNIGEVQTACGNPVTCPINITFSTQAEVDIFPSVYAGCTEISGDVSIYYTDDITNLDGLAQITSIGGSLYMWGNTNLYSISGLTGLTSIGGDVYLDDNDALTTLIGLENLVSIGGSLSISYNEILTSIEGLSSLISIGGGLYLYENAALTSLSGLESVDPNSIASLSIHNSPLLSICDLQNICDYLSDPSNTAYISGNATGCTSINQVKMACGLPVSCPNGITFTNQAQIDAYPIN